MKYDGHFAEIFQKLFDQDYRSRLAEKGIFYEHRLNDELLVHLYKIEGGVVTAMKNYDGDAQSDILAQAYSSAVLLTSALVSGDGRTKRMARSPNTIMPTFVVSKLQKIQYYVSLRGHRY